MCALDGFDIQVAVSFFLPDGCVSAIGERAGTADAQTRHVVRVLTERALPGDLALKRAELVVDNLPDDVVVLHGSISREAGGWEWREH